MISENPGGLMTIVHGTVLPTRLAIPLTTSMGSGVKIMHSDSTFYEKMKQKEKGQKLVSTARLDEGK